MKYGVVLACCKGSDGRAVCVVRGLDTLLSPLGDPITNAYDCPLLSLTRTIFTARTLDVLKAVSVVHECARTCEFKIKEYPEVLNVKRSLFPDLSMCMIFVVIFYTV